MKKRISMLLVLVMVFALTACGTAKSSETTEATAAASAEITADENTDVTILGEGETVFALTVADVEGNETAFEIHTNETTVGAALQALGLIAGEDGEYGLYINTVNGISSDWDADQTYWAFYINGEYALAGVDTTDIDSASTYSLVLTKG